MGRFLAPWKVGVSLLVAISLTQLQYRSQVARHNRLVKNGQTVKGEAIFMDGDISTVRFSFITKAGDTIQDFEKCDERTFRQEYNPLYIVYNAADPNEFDTLWEFNAFSQPYRKWFFLLFYPLFSTFFLLALLRNVEGLVAYLKARRSAER